MICESYYAAIRTAMPTQIEAIDMAGVRFTTSGGTSLGAAERQDRLRPRHGAAVVHAGRRIALERLSVDA